MDAGVTSFVLSYWVRTRGLFSLAEGIRRLTSQPARVIGLTDRGRLEAGLRADVNVFDLDKVGERQPELVHDFPGGAPRYIQGSTGYVATIVNGEVAFRDGQHSGARAGQVLRHGAKAVAQAPAWSSAGDRRLCAAGDPLPFWSSTLGDGTMGPLSGVKVIEIAGIGPGPFCGMMLADMGAEVLRIDRAEAVGRNARNDLLYRGKRSLAADLKKPEAIETILRLVEKADVITEGFRPGVMERLGLGPDVCLARNPRLIFGRMTGFGQDGPMARAAGHDINYIAMSGVLHAIGRGGERPVPPLNLVGDFGGGGMMLAFGVACALLEARQSGKGQVVDAAMVDGAATLATFMYGAAKTGGWKDERGSNVIDGGAHFYDTYETRDGRYISVGSIEPQFYAELVRLAGLDAAVFKPQMDRAQWPELKADLIEIFKAKTRDEWCAVMEGSDVCFAPVLGPFEAPSHPHNVARGTFIEIDGVTQPGPTPRFSRTAAQVANPPPSPGQDTDAALADWGVSADDIARLREAGAVA